MYFFFDWIFYFVRYRMIRFVFIDLNYVWRFVLIFGNIKKIENYRRYVKKYLFFKCVYEYVCVYRFVYIYGYISVYIYILLGFLYWYIYIRFVEFFIVIYIYIRFVRFFTLIADFGFFFYILVRYSSIFDINESIGSFNVVF